MGRPASSRVYVGFRVSEQDAVGTCLLYGFSTPFIQDYLAAKMICNLEGFKSFGVLGFELGERFVSVCCSQTIQQTGSHSVLLPRRV